ncbi:MAG: ABC transporter ATP-binding protein [Candidatus Binatia bacterium]
MTASQVEDGHVVFDQVTMAYGRRQVFRGLSCDFPKGKISVVLGGSGSGKSSMLRLIGGLVRPISGRILVEGVDVAGLGQRELYSVRNKLGMMFQGGALLDSLTVFDNIAFPLREHTGLSEEQISEEVGRRLAAVGLSNIEQLLPSELSGGMVKRVALARALMRNPVAVLIDEAFSGLDPVSIKLIEALLVKINQRYEMTMIIVSHHIPSTMRMADNVLLLLRDRVVQGSPDELANSSDERIRRFLNEDVEDAASVIEHSEDFESETTPVATGTLR